jgi:hypothetical protein
MDVSTKCQFGGMKCEFEHLFVNLFETINSYVTFYFHLIYRFRGVLIIANDEHLIE